MFNLSHIRKLFILSTITFMIMFIIPNLAVAGGHGGMGGHMSGHHGGSYYSGYYPTTTNTASLLGRYTPYATTIGRPYSAYGYSPYSTRIGSVLGSPLGGYGLGGYSGLGLYGGGLYGGGLYGGGIVTGKTYGSEQSYTTYVPGGEITETVSEDTDVVYPYTGLYGAGLGGYGLGGYGLSGYGLGAGYGVSPYGYGLGGQWI